MVPRRFIAGLAIAAVLTAAAPRPARAQQAPRGSVAGTAYLVTPRGEQRPAAIGTFFLLRDTEALRAGLAAVCQGQRRAAVAVEDSLGRRQREVGDTMQTPIGDPWTTWWEAETDVRDARIETRIRLAARGRAAVRRLLADAAVDSVPAGPDGSYRFAGLAAGRYIVFGEWTGGPATWRLWQPVALAEGEALTRPLRGSGEASDQYSLSFP